MPFDAGSPPGIDRAAKGPDPPNEGLQPDRAKGPKDVTSFGEAEPPQSIEENEACQTKKSTFVVLGKVYTLCQNTTKFFRRFLAEAQILKCKCCRRPGMEI